MKWIKRNRSVAEHIVSVEISILPDTSDGVARIEVKSKCNKAWNLVYPPFEDDIRVMVENFSKEVAGEIKNVCNRT